MSELQLGAKKCDFFDEIRKDGHHFMRYRFVIGMTGLGSHFSEYFPGQPIAF